MKRYILLSIFLLCSLLDASIIVDKHETKREIIKDISYFLDYSNKMTLSQIKKIDKFITPPKESIKLTLGDVPDLTAWIKIELKNPTNVPIEKVIESYGRYATSAIFYDGETIYKDGFYHKTSDRSSIFPSYKTLIAPNSQKIIYVSLACEISSLNVKMRLWNPDDFYDSELDNQFIIAFFIGALSILSIYHLIVFLFTKDYSFLLYSLYLTSYIALYSTQFVIMLWLDAESYAGVYDYVSILVTLPYAIFGLFIYKFVGLNQYNWIKRIFFILFILINLLSVIAIYERGVITYSTQLLALWLFIMIIASLVVSFRDKKQFILIFLGWSVMFGSGVMTLMDSQSEFDAYAFFPFFIEFGVIIDAIIFSIALAYRLKELQDEKLQVIIALDEQKKSENLRLSQEVDKKTSELKGLLDEKEVLLKEIHHRVKNNMQLVISILRLQSNKISDERYQEVFQTAIARINSMSNLYHLLYEQDNMVMINTNEYFTLIIDEIRQSYPSDIIINIEQLTNLEVNDAIYCGLILNELISNSYKHAFKNHVGEKMINIILTQNRGDYRLILHDNGSGYDTQKQSNTLGMKLIKTLASKQLKGTIIFDMANGCTTTIEWSHNG